VKEIKGAVKEVAGKAAGDTKLDSDGKADKVQARFKTPQAASKTHSKGNRLTARVLAILAIESAVGLTRCRQFRRGCGQPTFFGSIHGTGHDSQDLKP
jgi:uncharacterized protein YjbJ (UPF0337 family)